MAYIYVLAAITAVLSVVSSRLKTRESLRSNTF